MKSIKSSLAAALLGLSATASASVFLPQQHAASAAAATSSLTPSSPFVASLTRRQRTDLRLALRKQRSPVASTAMAIPGYGVAEQVFVGGFANFLSIYNFIITARILLSWFPQAQGIGALQPVYAVTDPYLNLFRGVIPPLFGLDFSPLLAFFLLNLLSNATAAVGCEIPPGFNAKSYQPFLTSKRSWGNNRRCALPKSSEAPSQLSLNL